MQWTRSRHQCVVIIHHHAPCKLGTEAHLACGIPVFICGKNNMKKRSDVSNLVNVVLSKRKSAKGRCVLTFKTKVWGLNKVSEMDFFFCIVLPRLVDNDLLTTSD